MPQQEESFIQGRIFIPLVRFALPVLLALFLQAAYGAVDLWVVGRWAQAADISGVATGSQIMHMLTCVITGLSMGVTVQVGQFIGEGRPEQAGAAIGAGIVLFALLGAVFTAAQVSLAPGISRLMQAPPEAFAQTTDYVRICSYGFVFIIAYNVLGAVFRGLGDSTLPLITVAIACVFNIGADLLFVIVFKMGAAGAALATVLAQGLSVIISLLIIKRRQLPFRFRLHDIRWDGELIGRIVRLGLPIAVQDLLVGLSFLLIMAIVNAMGLIFSAGVGVAEKLCAFIMLVPSAFAQSMSAFVAQNVGARRLDRARLALRYGIGVSLLAGVLMFWLAFFHGDLLAAFFNRDPQIIAAAFDYLKAYGVDCLFTPFLFCFIGYFNGCGRTLFVLIQGLVGAFGIRIPVAFAVSRLVADANLFQIGLATPASTLVQITLCLLVFRRLNKKMPAQAMEAAEPEPLPPAV